MKLRTKIINLFGGPGAGKSTTALGIAYHMKLRGMSGEIVTEFAKQMVWQERIKLLETNQAYVHAKQLHYLDSVVGKVEYIVTDSPTILSLFYGPKMPNSFKEFVWDTYHKYANINVYIDRVKPYNPVGRTQKTLAEAKKIDCKIKRFIRQHWSANVWHVAGDQDAAEAILDNLPQMEKALGYA